MSRVCVDFSTVSFNCRFEFFECLVVCPHPGEAGGGPGTNFYLYELALSDEASGGGPARWMASERVGASTAQSGNPNTVALKRFSICFINTSYVIFNAFSFTGQLNIIVP